MYVVITTRHERRFNEIEARAGHITDLRCVGELWCVAVGGVVVVVWPHGCVVVAQAQLEAIHAAQQRLIGMMKRHAGHAGHAES